MEPTPTWLQIVYHTSAAELASLSGWRPSKRLEFHAAAPVDGGIDKSMEVCATLGAVRTEQFGEAD